LERGKGLSVQRSVRKDTHTKNTPNREQGTKTLRQERTSQAKPHSQGQPQHGSTVLAAVK